MINIFLAILCLLPFIFFFVFAVIYNGPEFVFFGILFSLFLFILIGAVSAPDWEEANIYKTYNLEQLDISETSDAVFIYDKSNRDLLFKVVDISTYNKIKTGQTFKVECRNKEVFGPDYDQKRLIFY